MTCYSFVGSRPWWIVCNCVCCELQRYCKADSIRVLVSVGLYPWLSALILLKHYRVHQGGASLLLTTKRPLRLQAVVQAIAWCQVALLSLQLTCHLQQIPSSQKYEHHPPPPPPLEKCRLVCLGLHTRQAGLCLHAYYAMLCCHVISCRVLINIAAPRT